MSELRDAVAAALGSSGALARADPNHVEREAQLRMALGVADAISDRAALVVEAGTGVGKTYAYLVPTLLSGARALLSTATKSLQDQLFLRDLPRLRDALQLPVSVALLKGRGSAGIRGIPGRGSCRALKSPAGSHCCARQGHPVQPSLRSR